jgi:hypothetical protein
MKNYFLFYSQSSITFSARPELPRTINTPPVNEPAEAKVALPAGFSNLYSNFPVTE